MPKSRNQLHLFETTGTERLTQLTERHELNLQFKAHPRAKRLSIKIKPPHSVVITSPKQISKAEIDRFILNNWEWIENTVEKHITLTKAKGLIGKNNAMDQIPECFSLRAINESWKIELNLNSNLSNEAFIKELPGNGLQLTLGEKNQAELSQGVLKMWLKTKAELTLIPHLHEISKETGLKFRNAKIRAQKTRWGSCSSKQHINLNQHLLFLPPDLVRYIMIHELCHTKEMNHSKQFWTLVAHYEPRFERIERALKHAQALIPPILIQDISLA